MKKIKKLLVSAMALMMAFSTVACGGGDDGSSSSSQGGAGTSSSATQSGESSSATQGSESSSATQGGESSSATQGGESSSATQGGESSSATQGGTSSNPGSGNMGEYIPQNPYPLNVYSFSGGYGTDWLNAVENRYKKERAGDEIVVNGTKYDGVKFVNATDKNTLTSMVGTGQKYDVWFQEQVVFNKFVEQKGIFKDMTDVMTSANPYEPGKTLESKLNDQQKNYYMRDIDGDGVGEYYGIPHYAGYVGIVYNKDMFDDQYAYFAKDYDKELLKTSPDDCFVGGLYDERTPGPDGVEGTDDDGLPTTYEEFYALCGFISSQNKPIAWSGKHRHGYLGWFLTAMSANNEGAEQARLNYSFNGTATNLVTVTEDALGTPTYTELADLELDAKNNGYQLAQQKGKYDALKFLETIVDNGWYTENSFSVTNEQTDAQREFVEGVTDKTERPAMLIEGCWWEMEAKGSFATLEQGAVANPKDNFAWMPLPCVDEAAAAARAEKLSAGQKGYTLTDTHNSLCFIGGHVSDEVYAIAKDFVQFAYTDESLAEFSIITDTTKAVEYTMTNEQKAQMSAYGRSLMGMQEKSDIVYSFSTTEFFKRNEELLIDYKKNYSAIISSKQYDIAVDEFRKGVSAATYFNGLLEMQKNNWNMYIIKV